MHNLIILPISLRHLFSNFRELWHDNNMADWVIKKQLYHNNLKSLYQ